MDDFFDKVKAMASNGVNACKENLGVTVIGIGFGTVLTGFVGGTTGSCLICGIAIAAIGCWMTTKDE